MRIGVLGINHKLADLEVRDALAKACQKWFNSNFLSSENQHFILLSTCNRTEVYFCSDDLAFTHSHVISILRNEVYEDFDQKLYSFFGADCFHHLCRVTAGLDSAVVAETEIQGQVKLAYELSCKAASLPCDLHYLFQKSLKIGKSLRSELPLQRGLPNLEHAIYHHLQEKYSRSPAANVLIIGASEINFKVINHLKSKRFLDLTLCNRTDKKAEAASCKHGIKFSPWHLVHNTLHAASWQNYDAVIIGTKASEYILKADSKNVFEKEQLIIDLGVPRNADPLLGFLPKIRLVNIDELNCHLDKRKVKLRHLLAKAESFIEISTKKHLQLFLKKQKAKVITFAASA